MADNTRTVAVRLGTDDLERLKWWKDYMAIQADSTALRSALKELQRRVLQDTEGAHADG